MLLRLEMDVYGTNKAVYGTRSVPTTFGSLSHSLFVRLIPHYSFA